MVRKDIHRPSVIVPADYSFVAFDHIKIDGLGDAAWAMENRRRIQSHMAQTGGTYSNHEHGGVCHICGSVNAIYTALFYHEPTNTYVRVGQDCADQLDAGIVPAFRTFIENTRGAVAVAKGKKAAQVTLQEKGLSRAWEIYLDLSIQADGADGTIRDIVGKLVAYGNLSDKQFSFLASLIKRVDTWAETQKKRAEEAAKALPVPTGRVVVEGTIIKVAEAVNDFGIRTVITVKSADGWVVWGTAYAGLDPKVGETVKFKATITASDKPNFGFFKRPIGA